MSQAINDVIIIGSGPAGYTAAIYAARAQLQPVVFEGAVTAGGALMNTTEVENFPGFQDGIMGPALMENMRAQAVRFGANLITDDVTVADLTKDGFFFRDQDIAVVGGGDSAVEEATFLTRFAKSVTMIHRRDELRASKIMADRAHNDPKIKFIWNSEVADLHGDAKLSGITIRDIKSGKTSELPVTGLFVAIGHDPRSELLKGQVDLDPAGYVLTKAGTTQTNLSGVFACGDLVDHTYRQAITAAGTGCSAALDAERFLSSLHSK
jgi:thioredoxin reductase (NADPH)